MFKKVMSAVLAMFVCSCTIGSISSASINKDGNVPTKTCYKDYDSNDVPPKNLVKKRHSHSKKSVRNRDNDFDYFLERKEEMEEQRKEEEDRKIWSQEGVKESIYSLGYYSNNK